MNRKNKKILKYFGVFSIIILIFIGIYFGSGLIQSGLPSGFDLSSISKITGSSSVPNFNGETYLVTFTSGGLGQSLSGTLDLSPSEIESESGTKDEVVNGFRFTLDNLRESCKYTLNVDYNKASINKLSADDYGYDPTGSKKNSCFNDGGIYYQVGGLTHNSYCIYPKVVSSSPAYVGDATKDFNAKFTLAVDGESPVSKTLSTLGDQGIAFADYGYLKFKGLLSSGQSCPTGVSQGIVAVYVSGSWKTISESSYNNYRQYYENDIEDCFDNCNAYLSTCSQSEVNDCVNKNNNKADEALNTKSLKFEGGLEPKISGSLSSGQINLDLTKLIDIAEFSLYIKADRLIVETPDTKPSITSASSDCFKTGESGNVKVSVKNNGQDGNIRVHLECSGQFSQVGSTVELNVKNGKTVDFNIPITGTTSIDQSTNTCKAVAEATGGKSSKNVDVCVKGQSICNPNEYICIGNIAQQCNQYGTSYGTGIDCTLSGGQCVNGKCETPTGIITPNVTINETEENETIPTNPLLDECVTSIDCKTPCQGVTASCVNGDCLYNGICTVVQNVTTTIIQPVATPVTQTQTEQQTTVTPQPIEESKISQLTSNPPVLIAIILIGLLLIYVGYVFLFRKKKRRR